LHQDHKALRLRLELRYWRTEHDNLELQIKASAKQSTLELFYTTKASMLSSGNRFDSIDKKARLGQGCPTIGSCGPRPNVANSQD
jgi:hypothetical protein